MNEPATTHDDDDDIDGTMALKDWLEILGDDIDEAVADLVEVAGGDLDKLVAFLRAKADEIAAIELDEPDEDQEEEIERDEETEG